MSSGDDRCVCPECASGDALPDRLQGWPGAFQLKLFAKPVFDRYWRIRATLPERFGQKLRIVARGTMNSALVEFEDGTRHIVNRYAFRELPTAQNLRDPAVAVSKTRKK
jgi:hypothetical protein